VQEVSIQHILWIQTLLRHTTRMFCVSSGDLLPRQFQVQL
jgi:hypothetical protein